MATILWCILLEYYKISIKHLNTLNIRQKYKKKMNLLNKLINKKNDPNIGI